MRVTSAIWVSAYVRRCHIEGAFAVVRRRGAAEAGAVFVKLDRLDGTVALFAPAPQSMIEETEGLDRQFEQVAAGESSEAIDARLARELRFDPDLWTVEVEDRQGRHFLDLVKTPERR
jgi:hypothetical protein